MTKNNMISTVDRLALDEKLALACRILGGEQLTRAAFGHVSALRDDGTVAMKARGKDEEALEFATARDIITVGLDGKAIDAPPGLVAPNEAFIHTECFKLRPDIRSVVHLHPPFVVAMAAAGRRLEPIYGAFAPRGLRLATGTLRYYRRSLLISNVELGREVAETLGDGEACILHGHGVVTVGPSIESAVLTAIALAELAHVNWLAASVGELRPLPPDDIEAWTSFFESHPREIFGGRSDTGEPAEWHYYRRRDAQRRTALEAPL